MGDNEDEPLLEISNRPQKSSLFLFLVVIFPITFTNFYGVIDNQLSTEYVFQYYADEFHFNSSLKNIYIQFYWMIIKSEGNVPMIILRMCMF